MEISSSRLLRSSLPAHLNPEREICNGPWKGTLEVGSLARSPQKCTTQYHGTLASEQEKVTSGTKAL